MPKAHTRWRVLPHGPIEKLSDRLWRLQGDLEGMPLKRVMAIAKCDDGRLVIHSAIALEQELMQQIERWGEIAAIVVPNRYHRLDAAVFHERYPSARVLCPAGARAPVEQVVPVSGAYQDFAGDATVSLEPLDGTKEREGAMIVRAADGTSLVLNDLVFNMPHAAGFAGWVLRHITRTTGGPGVPPLVGMFFVSQVRAFRDHLERLAALPDLRRVLVAHHETIDREPDRVLREITAAA